MHINQLKESKFLKKEDCNPPILVTIKNLTQENMAMEGDPPEMKWVIHFNEVAKPMSLNSTNAQLIAQIVKSEETDDWTGHKIVLYSDPSISFGGKLVGGIRVRAPRNQPAAAPKPAPVAQPAPPIERGPATEGGVADSDCPF
jgi:hypothetical protein